MTNVWNNNCVIQIFVVPNISGNNSVIMSIISFILNLTHANVDYLILMIAIFIKKKKIRDFNFYFEIGFCNRNEMKS